MKKINRLVCFLLLMATAGMTAACSATGSTTPPETATTSAFKDFSAKLFATASQEIPRNPVISSTSAYLCLGMVATGAGGDTATAFESVLATPLSRLSQNCGTTTDFLETTQGATTLSIANSLWINETFTPKKAFTQSIKKEFGAEVFKQELSQSKDAINQWVSQATNGLIPTLLDEAPSKNDVLILIDTIYLKAKWQTPFDPAMTAEGPFTQADGTQTTVPYLTSDDYNCPYINEGDVEGVILPYDDDKTAFVALRPTGGQGVREMVASLSAADLDALLAKAEDKPLKLKVPKFEKETTFTMNNALTTMGLGLAFNPQKADFSAIGDQLFLSSVLQKAKITVDEAGTEAAAATAATIRVTALPPDSLTSVTFDSPFAYYVIDQTTGIPLFSGILDSPQS